MTGAKTAGIYRWAKVLRSPSEVATWETVIEISGLTTATISHVAGKKSWNLEIFNASEADALTWQKKFKGQIEYFSPEKLETLSQPSHNPTGKLLKIRDRILVSQETDTTELAKIKKTFPNRIVLSYPPALAFGTGDHATTATCLRVICDFAKMKKTSEDPSWDFLDLGCGSGILCAAANQLGAKSVLGLDFDEMAVRTARALAIKNGLDESTLIEGDVLSWQAPRQQTYDLIAANIFYDILTDIFPRIPAWLKPEGKLIISGILNTQEKKCIEAGEKAGFHFDRVIRKGKWSTAHGTFIE